ncbi:MAG: chromate resistance protein [Candidatus Cloacimonetes bacterium]|nr:chromate resistance protein [Candidatus Cloacimonadota bacterium]
MFYRCASIWLIDNFVDSTSTFEFIKFGSRVTKGIPFDVPGAELGRQRNISCFESIIQKYEITDSAIIRMANIIHDIDVNKWGIKITFEADSLELVFSEIRGCVCSIM